MIVYAESRRPPMTGLPASLPVQVKNPLQPKPTLSLASYRPENAMPEHDEAEESSQPRASSSRIRRALYAERDSARNLDPGALDFAVDEVEEEDGDSINDEDTGNGDLISSSTVDDKSKRKARKIIEARDSLPAEGMWRSLA
jgi:hypothetical protein